MIYRVIYLLGLSVALCIRFAYALVVMASFRRHSAPSAQRAGVHAVRHIRGGHLVRSDVISNEKRSVGTPTKVVKLAAPGAVSDRIKTIDLYSGKLLLGVLWIYMYPERSIARRVLKIQDRHLANALGRERWYYKDVPFDAEHTIESIVKDFHEEVSRQLDQRIVQAEKARTKERNKAEQVAAQAPAKAPAPGANQASVNSVVSPKAEDKQHSSVAPASAIEPAQRRQVKGESVVGTVTQTGMTKKTGSEGVTYQTFCLTIHDGVREIPYFGTELSRQVADIDIRPGYKINVVYMGKKKVSADDDAPRFKNLYQLTRVNA